MIGFLYIFGIVITFIGAVVGCMVVTAKYFGKLKRELNYLDQMVICNREALTQSAKEINNLNRYINSLSKPVKTEKEIKEKYEEIRQQENQAEDTIYDYSNINLREVGSFADENYCERQEL